MRTHLFRGVAGAGRRAGGFGARRWRRASSGARSIDAQGKPVDGATVVFEAKDANRKTQTKTDKNGEFLQVGLQSGALQGHGVEGQASARRR